MSFSLELLDLIRKNPAALDFFSVEEISVFLHFDSTLNISQLVDKQCKKTEISSTEKKSNAAGFFLIKSSSSSEKDIFLCSPPGTASHRAVAYLQTMLKINCGDGNLKHCSVSSKHPLSNDTIQVMFVRHPFDRLILDFRHKNEKIDNKKASRKLLYHRYSRKKKKNDFYQFRKYIQTSVLSPNSTIKPISQVCQVCTKKFDLFFKLDGSLSILNSLHNISRNQSPKHMEDTLPQQKTISQKQQRKYFSQITAEEMESLVEKFKDDFLYFGYNFLAFKRALKNSE
jgi:hypothetical protein